MAIAFLCVVFLLQDYYHVKFPVVVLSHIIVFLCDVKFIKCCNFFDTFSMCFVYLGQVTVWHFWCL